MELKRNSRLPIRGMILVKVPFTSQGHWKGSVTGEQGLLYEDDARKAAS
jgi:hypothetical protein